MHPRTRFENPPALPHEVVAEALERTLSDPSHEGDAADYLGRVLPSRKRIARRQSGVPRALVHCRSGRERRRTARCSGWLACASGACCSTLRASRDVAVELAESLATRADEDPTDVDGRALDGLDDIRSFLRPR